MKKSIVITILFISFLFLPNSIKAETNIKGYVIKNDTLFTSKANIILSSCLVRVNGKSSTDYGAPGILHCLDSAEEVTILNYDSIINSTIESCKTGYYKVTAKASNGNSYNGYVCADYIKVNTDSSKYSEEFSKAGFPESYWEKLAILKETHPNWKFTTYKTGLDWNDVVNAESVVGISFIQVTNLSSGAKYISLDSGSYDPVNKTYIVKEGSNWYAANKETVAYYIDPRNFLTEKEIFMFENLGYNPTYQTLDVIQNIFKNTDLYQYAPYYIEAANYKNNSISPVSLAASSRQEVVLSDGKLSNSANGTMFKDKSVYNFFNIGAFSTGCKIDGISVKNPVTCAQYYAYNRGWTDPKTAIIQGALEIADGYINQKQNTLYFKKYNVTSNVYGNYSHQYMTNIKAPVSEGISTYNAYSKITDLLNSSIEFLIPVYENMPEKTTLPADVDNTKKEELDDEAKKEEETASIVDIVNKAGYQYNNDYISGVSIGTTAQAFISNVKGTSSSAIVTVTTIDANGSTKEINDATRLGTGDIVTIKSGNESRNFRIVIYGDVNGDGKINSMDCSIMYKEVMTENYLRGSYKLSADIDKNGKIDSMDFAIVYKRYMESDYNG